MEDTVSKAASLKHRPGPHQTQTCQHLDFGFLSLQDCENKGLEMPCRPDQRLILKSEEVLMAFRRKPWTQDTGPQVKTLRLEVPGSVRPAGRYIFTGTRTWGRLASGVRGPQGHLQPLGYLVAFWVLRADGV
ncbi:uncharacterized protein LOC144576921 [Callithrix jacchus]